MVLEHVNMTRDLRFSRRWRYMPWSFGNETDHSRAWDSERPAYTRKSASCRHV